MLRSLSIRASCGTAFGLAAALALGARQAHAAGLDCGALNPHAQVYAGYLGQPPAQATDMAAHPLPWSNDLAQQVGESAVRKSFDATCQSDGSSLTVNLSSTEWGAIGANRPNDQVRASWAPMWIAHVTLAPRKQLSISVASSVNRLNCQLIAPGVAMNWAIPYSNTQSTPAGVRDFTVALECASGGLHDVNRQLVSGWVNGESILINLTVLNTLNNAL